MQLFIEKFSTRLPLRRRQVLWIVTFLAFTLAAATALRAATITRKSIIEHDEGISYLAAACRQGNYYDTEFGLTPRPASQWKQFWQVERPFCFGQISSDLSETDIHPPLYFWLLHVWILIFGVHPWSGPALNTLLAIATTLVLFRLATLLLENYLEAAFVTFTYALNPSVILYSRQARQYDLLALCTLLLIWQTVKCVNSPTPLSKKSMVWLVLTAVAGGLTHYHFLLVVTTCLAFTIMKSGLKNRTRGLKIGGGLGIGYGLSFLIHPFPTHYLAKQQQILSEFSLAELSARIEIAASNHVTFSYVALLFLVLIIAGLFFYRRDPAAFHQYRRTINLQGSTILFFSLWIVGAVIVLYLTFVTPKHTMINPRYLAMVWPFLAFLPLFALRLVRHRSSVLLYLFLVPLLSALLIPWQIGRFTPAGNWSILQSPDLIIIDNSKRGIFLQILQHIPDEKLVLVASQDELLERPEEWLGHLTDNNIYLSKSALYRSEVEKQQQLCRAMEEAGYKTIPSETLSNLDTAFTTFEVHPDS